MCKEGIRIGRRAVAATVQSTVQANQLGTVSLPPRPERIGVILSIVPAGMLYGDAVGLAVMEGGAPLFVGMVSGDTPSITLSVETHGQLVTGALSVFSAAALPVAYYLTELYLTMLLSDL